jgi:hypothetical protein
MPSAELPSKKMPGAASQPAEEWLCAWLSGMLGGEMAEAKSAWLKTMISRGTFSVVIRL